MKSTSMAPRIDELGRVVIPKAIRTRMKINDNDPLKFSYPMMVQFVSNLIEKIY